MPRASKTTESPAIRVRPKPTRRATDRARRPAVSPNDIARLAYAIYEARGRRDGAHLDDWLEAERQLVNGA